MQVKKLLPLGIFLIALIFGIKSCFFSRPFLYAGTLEATKVDLAARLPAAITTVTVHEGDRVTQGQTLITFACEDYKIEARLAEENY